MSELVGTPKDRFSRVAAQIILIDFGGLLLIFGGLLLIINSHV